MTTPDLAPAATEVARIVAGVRDEQLTDPTPCADTSVAAMLDHLVGLTLGFRMAAEKTPMQGARRADAAQLAPDWRDRLPQQLDALVAAWEKPAASEGMAEAGGAQLPAPMMGLVALNEVLVHGWDLAVATGQPYRADPSAAERCLAFAAEFDKAAPGARDGIYGPVVPVPDNAPAFDRLLGQTGRDPRWTPSA
jgi:uncharacterized protein (TIGR03086 family)